MRLSAACYGGRVLALQALTPEELSQALPELRLAEARRIVSSLHRSGRLEAAIPQVRRSALSAVRAATHVPGLERVSLSESALDPFVKLVLRVPGGDLIETVRIPLERPGRFSICVSAQVGCALACAFCATGKLGLRRNLAVWEIVEQVREAASTLGAGQRVHGVVFQGMGEPLANLDQVLGAIRVLNEPSGLAIDARNITVCTAGLPSGIRRLAREAPKVRLGLSLGSALPEVRGRLMPITNAHSFDAVMEAAVEHARLTRRAPMWALTLLAGVNDDEETARRLADRIAWFTEQAGVRPRLSLIPYNATSLGEGDPFSRSPQAVEERFREVLRDRGVGSHRRYSGGGDVGAACGQLAARAQGVSGPGRERQGPIDRGAIGKAAIGA